MLYILFLHVSHINKSQYCAFSRTSIVERLSYTWPGSQCLCICAVWPESALCMDLNHSVNKQCGHWLDCRYAGISWSLLVLYAINRFLFGEANMLLVLIKSTLAHSSSSQNIRYVFCRKHKFLVVTWIPFIYKMYVIFVYCRDVPMTHQRNTELLGIRKTWR